MFDGDTGKQEGERAVASWDGASGCHFGCCVGSSVTPVRSHPLYASSDYAPTISCLRPPNTQPAKPFRGNIQDPASSAPARGTDMVLGGTVRTPAHGLSRTTLQAWVTWGNSEARAGNTQSMDGRGLCRLYLRGSYVTKRAGRDAPNNRHHSLSVAGILSFHLPLLVPFKSFHGRAVLLADIRPLIPT